MTHFFWVSRLTHPEQGHSTDSSESWASFLSQSSDSSWGWVSRLTHPGRNEPVFFLGGSPYRVFDKLVSNLLTYWLIRGGPTTYITDYHLPPTDGGGLRFFYHNWTNRTLKTFQISWNCETSGIRGWLQNLVWAYCVIKSTTHPPMISPVVTNSVCVSFLHISSEVSSHQLYYEVYYYESIKREPKIRGIKKCRCDERLQTKTKEFTRLPTSSWQVHLECLHSLRGCRQGVCSISLKTVSVRFEFCKICKMVLLPGDGVVNYRKSYAVSQLTKKIHRWIVGTGLGLGKPKQDICLRFGLSVYRIFGSETEEGGPRAQHHLGLSCQIFVLGNARHSGE